MPLALTLALAGCGGNVSVSRGFGSREVLPLRDPTADLNYVNDVQGQDPTLVYSTQDADGTVTYWSLDLETGALADVGPSPPASGTAGPSAARYVCATQDLQANGSKTLAVTDTTTGAKTTIDLVTSFDGCVHDDGTLLVFRLDPATGRQHLWTGPFSQLAPVPLSIDILNVALYPSSSAGQPPTVIVMGAPPDHPEAAGIYSIDLGAQAVTQLVPPAPASTAWAPGAPQAGSLESASVSLQVQIGRLNGHYIYARTMSDGGTTLFAGPLPAGPASELALFQITPSGAPALYPGLRVSASDDAGDARVVAQMASWQVDGADDTPSQLVVWDDDAEQVTICPSAPGAFQGGVLSADGTHVLFRALQLGGQLTTAPLQLLNRTAGQPRTCVALEDADVSWADFSGESSTVAWLLKQDGGESELWTANSDGTDAKMILSGEIAARFVAGTTHLEMSYSGDLVWLDVRDASHFSYVAERLFGYPTAVGGSWFVAGYNYSAQDASGPLGVVDLDSGRKLSISPAVSQYLVAPQTAPVDGGAASEQMATGLYHVVYLVRGRNASSQDGIWVATVQAADLQ